MEPTGTWGHDDLPYLDLTFDAAQNVVGTTYWRGRGRSEEAPITSGRFDSTTNRLTLEGDAPSLDGVGVSHYVIEGFLDGDVLSGTYDCGGLTGTFSFTRIGAATA